MKILILLISMTLGACDTTAQAPKSTDIVYKIISAGAAYCYHVANLKAVTPIKCTANVSLATETIELEDLTYHKVKPFTKEEKDWLVRTIQEELFD